MPLTRSLSALTRHRIGLILAAVVLLVIAIGPALASRLTSNVGLVMLNRSLAQDGVFGGARRDDPSLAEAERWLSAATNLDATNRGAWRDLGFVWAAQGQEDEAVDAWRASGVTAEELIQRGESLRKVKQYEEALVWYKWATILEPGLGDPWYDMGLAYEGLAEWDKALSAHERAIKINYKDVEMGEAEIVALGDQALRHSRYTEAFAWYTRIARLEPPSHSDLVFKMAITTILARRSEAPLWLEAVYKQDNTFTVYPVEETLKIEGGNFRRIISALDAILPNGAPLAYTNGGSSGMLCCSGEAVAVISADRDDSYVLKVRVRHSAPPPVEMAIGVDGQQLRAVSLGRGDNSWETVEVSIELNEGLHTLSIWFLNDLLTEISDRNLEVAWVELQRQ